MRLHGGPHSKNRRLIRKMAKNQKPQRPSKKKIQALIKKEGKIRTAFILRNKHEMTVKDIAEALEISERTTRAYQWRVKEPEKYKALLKRYFDKKKAKAQKKQKKEKEAEEK